MFAFVLLKNYSSEKKSMVCILPSDWQFSQLESSYADRTQLLMIDFCWLLSMFYSSSRFLLSKLKHWVSSKMILYITVRCNIIRICRNWSRLRKWIITSTILSWNLLEWLVIFRDIILRAAFKLKAPICWR